MIVWKPFSDDQSLPPIRGGFSLDEAEQMSSKLHSAELPPTLCKQLGSLVFNLVYATHKGWILFGWSRADE
jgi:hypothetical protein